MMQPRSFTPEDRRTYLDDIRPRFLLLRVRADGVNIVWGVPLWALEEVVAFAFGALAFVSLLHPLLPPRWRARMAGFAQAVSGPFTTSAVEDSASGRRRRAGELFALTNELAGGSLQNVLRLPPGEPYVLVDSGDTRVELTAH